MTNLKLREASIDDLSALQLIGIQTFKEAFASDNSVENMNAYISKAFSIETLRTQLSSPNTQFYLALLNDKVVGYLKINFEKSQLENKNNKGLEIERIYVYKEFYGKKIGQFMLDKAIAISKITPVNYIWLGVWEHNPRAIRFYEKNGFVAFDKHAFILGDENQTDILMKLQIT